MFQSIRLKGNLSAVPLRVFQHSALEEAFTSAPPTCWRTVGSGRSISDPCELGPATQVSPLLQPALPVHLSATPSGAWTNNRLIEAKSRAVVEIQHLLAPHPTPPLQAQKGGYYVETSSL